MALKFFDAEEPFDFSLAGREVLLREIRPSGMNSKFPAGAENGFLDAVRLNIKNEAPHHISPAGYQCQESAPLPSKILFIRLAFRL